MSGPGHLKRKSFFVDERQLARAKKILGVPTDAEVVRLSIEQVIAAAERRGDLVDFLQSSPLVGVELDVSRSRDTGRKVDL
jgi:hypothetical protein